MRSRFFGGHCLLSSRIVACEFRLWLRLEFDAVFEDWVWFGGDPETHGAVVRGGSEHKPV